MYEYYNKRQPIMCETCGSEMVFQKGLLRSTKEDVLYLEYVCPRREGERGCGATKRVRFEREPEVKFRRTVDNSFVRL